ncbi:stress protein [Aspergillus terreus]|uniref:Stress protein n=1 Tax=Aspergillus terreus TaxID=33178 RepID=A0A5M3ZC59_ASPTE|nr:hypothetical protein ATETN484_0013035800 [Aspergillus terreus]GFF20592.1 stress protein [Aspergillus terreus]
MLPPRIGYGLASFLVSIIALLTFAFWKKQKARAITTAGHVNDPRSDEKQCPSNAPPPFELDTGLQTILSAEADRLFRGDWVIRLAGHFYARYGKRYNVLVINAAIEKIFMPEGVVEKFQTVYRNKEGKGPVTYEVYVFKRGTLVNMGDGGYINWCFFGQLDRSGMSVRFDETAA